MQGRIKEGARGAMAPVLHQNGASTILFGKKKKGKKGEKKKKEVKEKHRKRISKIQFVIKYT